MKENHHARKVILVVNSLDSDDDGGPSASLVGDGGLQGVCKSLAQRV